MKSVLVLILSIFLSANIYANAEDILVGSWLFESLSFGEETMELDEEGKKMIEAMTGVFSGTKFDFRKDKSYSIFLMGQEDFGTWEYEEKKKIIIMHSKQEGDNEIKVVSVDATKLILDLEGSILSFKKEKIGNPAGSLEQSNERFMKDVPAIKIDKNLIANKWELVEYKDDKQESEFLKSASSEIAKTVSYDINPNGKYKYKALGTVTKGKWKTTDDGLAFQATANGNDGSTITWFVLELSSNQLIMQQRNKEKKWIFKAN